MTKGLKSVTFETREPPPPMLLSLFILWPRQPRQPQRPATCDLYPFRLDKVCARIFIVCSPRRISYSLFVICYLLLIWYLLFAIAIHVECVVTSNAIGIYKTFFWPNFKCNFTPRFFSAVLKFVKYPVAGRKRYFNLYCILIC